MVQTTDLLWSSTRTSPDRRESSEISSVLRLNAKYEIKKALQSNITSGQILFSSWEQPLSLLMAYCWKVQVISVGFVVSSFGESRPKRWWGVLRRCLLRRCLPLCSFRCRYCCQPASAFFESSRCTIYKLHWIHAKILFCWHIDSLKITWAI